MLAIIRWMRLQPCIHTFDYLRVSLDQVRANFKAYNLLDNQVRFVKGFFKDTMPSCPVKQLAILRLDGDMYESTIQVLEVLYDRLSIGGYIIVDDIQPTRRTKSYS